MEEKVIQESYSSATGLTPMAEEDTTMVVAKSDATANQQYNEAKKQGFQGSFTQFMDWAKKNDVLGKGLEILSVKLGGGQGAAPTPEDDSKEKMKKILMWSAVGLVVVVTASIVIYKMNKSK